LHDWYIDYMCAHHQLCVRTTMCVCAPPPTICARTTTNYMCAHHHVCAPPSTICVRTTNYMCTPPPTICVHTTTNYMCSPPPTRTPSMRNIHMLSWCNAIFTNSKYSSLFSLTQHMHQIQKRNMINILFVSTLLCCSNNGN